jgi:hypothetical protein
MTTASADAAGQAAAEMSRSRKHAEEELSAPIPGARTGPAAAATPGHAAQEMYENIGRIFKCRYAIAQIVAEFGVRRRLVTDDSTADEVSSRKQ